ncbi:MAG TPA: DUF4147 domain-containing protein [Thermoanaerobaculia bacterium]
MSSPTWSELRRDLEALHRAALAAADPRAAVTRVLALHADGLRVGDERVALTPTGRLWLVAAGKASLGMAEAAIAALGKRISGGVVAHPVGAAALADGRARWPAEVRRIAAGHPLPDDGSLAAGEQVSRLVAEASSDDVVLVLLSGGASALLESLQPGVSLAALRQVTLALQHAGADLAELNTVRRCLSGLKGGGLARRAAPARVVTLALSDVLGDRPEDIGSGPTVPSPTGPREAMEVLARSGVASTAPAVMAALGRSGEPPSAPAAPADRYHVIASNRLAAEAVARAAARRGFRSQVVTTFLQGEAREAGKLIGGCAASVLGHAVPFAAPACLVFGGETTVTVRGSGRGGRNQEVALGAALALAGWDHAAVFSFATDGIDGPTAAAGAIATGDTVGRAAALGLSPHRALADNDSEPFFRALGDLWVSGPTGTNVNDLTVALAYP